MEEEIKVQEPVLMVVDIGGSKYMPGFVDGAGKILYQERRKWNAVEPEAIVEQLKEALWDICRKCPELAQKAKAGGFTIPGFADPVTGVWVDSDFLIVKDLPICEIFAKEFGIPFFADNDCNACALAERYFGGAKGLNSFLYLTVSTGIGGALYLDGELWYGGFWHAGEIGLFVVEEQGRLSDTGSVNGVLEMYASGRGLTQNYIEAGGLPKIDGKTPQGPEISRLARDGDKAAQKALELEGRYLGRAAANACAFADFEKIILGGGLSILFEQYEQALFLEFSRIWPDRKVGIEATELGYSGAFLGAAAVAIRGLNGAVQSRNAGLPEEIVLRVKVKERGIKGILEVGNRPCNWKEADFGGFLAAAQIGEQGLSLKELAALWNPREQEECSDAGNKEANEALLSLGHQIGKAVACACVLLDPEKVILEGEGVQCSSFQDGLLETVKRETYYRGKLPFSIEFG